MLSTAELQLLFIQLTICFVESMKKSTMKSIKYNLGWAVVVVTVLTFYSDDPSSNPADYLK